MRRLFAGLLIVVMMLMLSSTAFAEMVVQTGENGARLRSSPSVEDNNTILKIHQYEYLTVLRQNGQWYYVSYGNTKGYVHSGNTTIVSAGGGYTDSYSNGSNSDNPFNGYSSNSGNPFNNYNDGYSSNPFDNYNGGYSSNPFDYYYGEPVYGGDIKENYEQYGGQAVEQFAYAGRNGCKMRSEMDINNSDNVVHSIHRDEDLYLYCSFYSYGNMWYYAITRDGYEGFVHSGNVVLRNGW